MAQHLSQHCLPLEHPNWFAVTLAAFLVIGIVASYLPQHYKILSNKSSAGISPWWVLLGGLSSIAAIANILTLPTSRADMACCKELSGGACAAALLGVAQIGLQWTCFMIMSVLLNCTVYCLSSLSLILPSVLLYIVFFPATADDVEDMTSSTASITKTHPANRRDPLIVGAAIFLSLFTVALISVVLVFSYPHHTQNWANVLGTISGSLAAVQYLPQIWFTYRLGDVGNLSVLTLAIQAPGAFVFALSLYLRVGPEGWR